MKTNLVIGATLEHIDNISPEEIKGLVIESLERGIAERFSKEILRTIAIGLVIPDNSQS